MFNVDNDLATLQLLISTLIGYVAALIIVASVFCVTARVST